MATQGTYFRTTLEVQRHLKENPDLQQTLPKLKSCHVCAIGSAFVSYARLFNSVKAYEEDNYIAFPHLQVFDTVEKIFSVKSCKAMEACFERGEIHEVTGAKEFWREHRTPKKCLKAIMQNVIRHKGEFIIPKKYVKAAKAEAKRQAEIEERELLADQRHADAGLTRDN